MARAGRWGKSNTDTIDTPEATEPIETFETATPKGVEGPTFVEPSWTQAEDSPETAPVTENVETETVADETATKTERKRGPRPAINVGEVIVTPSNRTDFSTRETRMDKNPVFIAVKNAEKNTPYDLHVDEDKVEGVLSILRRAGAKLEVGMHIASTRPPSDQREGAVIVTFKTGDRRTRAEATTDESDAA